MSQEFNKTTKGIIYGIGALALVVCLVACSGHNDTTAQNPPAESTPVESTAPVAPPNPVVENAAKEEPTPEPTPEVTPEVVPTVEPEPVVTPEPPVETTPAEPEKTEPSPEPEKEPEKEPVKTETPVVTPEPEPVVDQTQKPSGPDESNKREEQARQEAQQSASSKFVYPPNSTTEGLTAWEINNGAYIDKATGIVYDQEGTAMYRHHSYQNGSTDDNEAASKVNTENANKIYNGDGSGSDTSGWGG